jgi:hypothetical protein
MTPSRAPLTLARAGCELAVRRLPDLDDRLRYRAEFLADLHALTPGAQLRYVAGVLSQAFALRAALNATPTGAEKDAMTLTTARTSFNWRCRLFRKHRYVLRSTEDGNSRYRTCVRCGHDSFGPSSSTGGLFAHGI